MLLVLKRCKEVTRMVLESFREVQNFFWKVLNLNGMAAPSKKLK